eukprot:1014161_1
MVPYGREYLTQGALMLDALAPPYHLIHFLIRTNYTLNKTIHITKGNLFTSNTYIQPYNIRVTLFYVSKLCGENERVIMDLRQRSLHAFVFVMAPAVRHPFASPDMRTNLAVHFILLLAKSISSKLSFVLWHSFGITLWLLCGFPVISFGTYPHRNLHYLVHVIHLVILALFRYYSLEISRFISRFFTLVSLLFLVDFYLTASLLNCRMTVGCLLTFISLLCRILLGLILCTLESSVTSYPVSFYSHLSRLSSDGNFRSLFSRVYHLGQDVRKA